MRVLLDNNVDRRMKALLSLHEVDHVQQLGWEHLKNGELLATAENAVYDALITADKNIRHQQSMRGRKISILVLNSVFVHFQAIRPLVPNILDALTELQEGVIILVEGD